MTKSIGYYSTAITTTPNDRSLIDQIEGRYGSLLEKLDQDQIARLLVHCSNCYSNDNTPTPLIPNLFGQLSAKCAFSLVPFLHQLL